MKIPAGRPFLVPLAASMFLAKIVVHAAPTPGPSREIDDYGEIFEHLIGEQPRVTTAWVDTTTERDSLDWRFHVVVDEHGVVKTAWLKEGSTEHREEARLAAEAARFKPFLRGGKPATVVVELDVRSRPADYAGPVDRSFPAGADLSTAIIALARSQCLGTCPDYRVEIRGDGEVQYEGHKHVVVPGKLRWRIDPALIAPLLGRFRKADYFKLAASYEAPVTDLPGYTTRLSFGGRHKTVYDYGGGGDMGETMASTGMPGAWPDMPAAVVEIEAAVDEISGVKSFVEGDDTTLHKLRAQHWDLRSRDAGNAVRKLLSKCKTALAREFIGAGAPVDNAGHGEFGDGMPITFAVRCADVDLVRVMLDRGALKKPAETKDFLWASVASGDPRMVGLALQRNSKVNDKNEDGMPLLSHAAGSYVSDDDAPNATIFDSVKVIGMLIDAGADPNARDEDGKTPVFEAKEADVAAALLRRGADPNARDNEGRTALFDHYFASPTRALIAAGADVNALDRGGRTALFFQEDPNIAQILIDAGANLEIADKRGRTAVEQMNSSGATAILLAAGAKLPADSTRRETMIAKATKEGWIELLPQLMGTKP